MESVRRLLVALSMAILASAALAPAALANGVGDLYAATPGGVLELQVDTQAVVSTVPVAPAPIALAFANDGRTLFTVSGGRHIASVDIATISPGTQRDVPENATGVAVPKGTSVVVAYPSGGMLGAWDPGADVLSQSGKLPGAPDLLTADRRDPHVAAAQSGKSWIASWNPADNSLRTTTVPGRVVAIAMDRDRGGVFVATSGPNKVYRLKLPSLSVDWSTAIPAIPSALAVLSGGVVAGGGTALWAVTSKSASPWATTAGAIRQLVASDEGSVLYAAETVRVEAFASAGTLARTITLSGEHAPRAIAPVPHASSIANGGGTGRGTGRTGGTGNATNGGSGTPKPVPVTSTVAEDVGGFISRTPIVGSAAAVAGIVFGAVFATARWYVRRQPED